MRFIRHLLYRYHRWMSERHRVEGAYQTGKFMRHRNKMHKYGRRTR